MWLPNVGVAAATTDSVNCVVSTCNAWSVTVTENVDVPNEVGVPEIRPAEESVKPAGSEPTLTAHT